MLQEPTSLPRCYIPTVGRKAWTNLPDEKPLEPSDSRDEYQAKRTLTGVDHQNRGLTQLRDVNLRMSARHSKA